MLDLRPLAFITGALLSVFGVAMLLPAMLDLSDGHKNGQAFLISAAATFFTGVSLVFAGRSPGALDGMNLRQAFLLTSLSEIVLAVFGALPFILANPGLDFTSAFFETMSGLTTTGATVMTGLDRAPRGLLLWRGLLQWLGGIGIIVFAAAILPTLRIGGMQLFHSESGGVEKILPRVGQLAGAIGVIYFVLSILCAVALWLAGMTPFEAGVNAMATISAGGFSTSDKSFAHWNSAWIEGAALPFMLIAAVPFTLLWAAMRGDVRRFWQDSQVKAFLSITAVAIAVMTLYQWARDINPGWGALRHAAFNITALTSGTGFLSANYSRWGPFAMAVAMFLILLGGCTGSAASGLKIFRLQLLLAACKFQIKRVVHASGVFKAQYNQQPLPLAAASAVTGFFFLYALAFAITGVLLVATGLDIAAAFSVAAGALANSGPGPGAILSLAGNYSALPNAAIWLLSAAMLIGRLELLPVFVLFLPRFWRG